MFSLSIFSGTISNTLRFANPGAGDSGRSFLVGTPAGAQITFAIVVVPGVGDFAEDDYSGRSRVQRRKGQRFRRRRMKNCRVRAPVGSPFKIVKGDPANQRA